MRGWIFVNLFLLVMLKIGREVYHISSKSLFFCDVGVLIAKRLADPQRPGLCWREDILGGLAAYFVFKYFLQFKRASCELLDILNF